MNRREILKTALLGAAALALRPASATSETAAARLAAIEHEHGGRLGVAVLDTGNGRRASYRDKERFLLCSTFKLLLVAAVLAQVDAGREQLERRVVFGRDAILDWAPVTGQHTGPPGLTVAQLCEAAITISDNTAANLLLSTIGGPAAVTAYARRLGDPVTRLDRTEPELNRPDGDKDTTTPLAMLADMDKLLLGNALAAPSRRRLTQWLEHCKTGTDSLRAGLPANWREGDKTGSGDTASNDIAILWPPGRKPLLVTAYYDNAEVSARQRKVVLAATGRVAARFEVAQPS